MVDTLKYFVMRKQDTLVKKFVINKEISEYVPRFVSAAQAQVYKLGLEQMYPDREYAVFVEIPKEFKQVSVWTGEKDHIFLDTI